jgi:hypothetical protein
MNGEIKKPVTHGQIIRIPDGHCEFRGKSIRVESCVIARAGSNGLRHGPEFYSWSWRIGGRVVKKDGTPANDGRHFTRFFVRLDWKPEPAPQPKA